MIAAGIDVGSVAIKGVLWEEGSALAQSAMRTDLRAQDAIQKLLTTCLEKIGRSIDDIGWVISTGIPVNILPAPGESVSLLKCLITGVRKTVPLTRTVIDVGAENVTAISIGPKGEVMDYCFNDNCAAGAGIYLEATARLTGNELTEMIDKANHAHDSVPINSVCTVFAEQEVISSAFVSPPIPIESILLGIHEAIATRVSGLVHRVGVKEVVSLCGGVARNKVFVKSLIKRLKVKIEVVDEPEMAAARGAAILASKHIKHKIRVN